jgi:molybdopterin-guanine dinucleotide biosynthesis protein A
MGRDKLELEFRGMSLLRSAIERFSPDFDVLLSVAETERLAELSVARVTDVYPGLGPMAGLHAGLLAAQDEGVFLLAADLPLATAGAALRLISLSGGADAIVIRREDGKLEPLFGYYRKTLLAELARSLENGEQKMTDFLHRVDARFIAPSELGDAWTTDLLVNVNRPEDYERLTRDM